MLQLVDDDVQIGRPLGVGCGAPEQFGVAQSDGQRRTEHV
jgi:hypothetical protein